MPRLFCETTRYQLTHVYEMNTLQQVSKVANQCCCPAFGDVKSDLCNREWMIIHSNISVPDNGQNIVKDNSQHHRRRKNRRLDAPISACILL